MTFVAKDYLDFIPPKVKFNADTKIKVLNTIFTLLDRAAKHEQADVDEVHIIQALTHYRNYNISPLTGHIYYQFNVSDLNDVSLFIGAKISAYQLVASRSGINAGNDNVIIDEDKSGNITSATATVKSVDKTTGKIVSTTETVYFAEAYRDTPLWNDSPRLAISRAAYAAAMRMSPMNDGSLSGVYLDSEIDTIVSKPQRATKPKVKPKSKDIKKTIARGKQTKRTKMKGRYDAGKAKQNKQS